MHHGLWEGVSFTWIPNGMGFNYGQILMQSATHSLLIPTGIASTWHIELLPNQSNRGRSAHELSLNWDG